MNLWGEELFHFCNFEEGLQGIIIFVSFAPDVLGIMLLV